MYEFKSVAGVHRFVASGFSDAVARFMWVTGDIQLGEFTVVKHGAA